MLHRLLPPADADPKETLRWTRRLEVFLGALLLAVTLALWGEIRFHWILVAAALLALSPWPGPAAILRKAEAKPEVLVTDPEQRRKRARRVVPLLVLTNAAVGAVVGYLVGGWATAAGMCALLAVIGLAVGWWSHRRLAPS